MPFSRWSDTLRVLLNARPELNADNARLFWRLCKIIFSSALASAHILGIWLCLTLFGIVTI